MGPVAEPASPDITPGLAATVGTAAQVGHAAGRLRLQAIRQPRLPWDSLHDVTGPIWPGEFWVLAAATGNGKTGFLLNAVTAWAEGGTKVYYLPLEQPPGVVRLMWAALGCGISPGRALGGGCSTEEQARITDHLRWQERRDGGRMRVMFDEETKLTVNRLQGAVDEACRFGADIVVIDHLHHLWVEKGTDYQALRELCHTILELGRETGLRFVAAAQLHRDKEGDMLAPFLPPKPSAIQGGEVVRQACHVALGLYRPLRRGLTVEERHAIRMGETAVTGFLEPNTIGVHVLKHRIHGERLGAIVKLGWEKGVIRCTDTDQRLLYEQRNGL